MENSLFMLCQKLSKFKMHTLNYIRKNTYRRNDNIFKKVYGKRTLSKNFSLFRVNPYSKIKTILNIEIACLLIYLLLRTKLSANIVSISGVVWTLIGIIFLSFYNSFLFLSWNNYFISKTYS